MIGPITLAELVTRSRITRLRDGIVTTLSARLPECQVKGHPGKLDIADIVQVEFWRPPALAVAVTRIRPDDRLSGSPDMVLDATIYVITEDGPLAGGGPVVYRDELGFALCQEIISLVEQQPISRWGLSDISWPSEVEAKPVFTAQSFERGLVFYGVTWKQTLHHIGSPLWDMDSPAPPELPPLTIEREDGP